MKLPAILAFAPLGCQWQSSPGLPVLLPWLRSHDRVDMQYEKRHFYLALYAWAITDLAVAIAFLPIFR